MGKGVLRRLYSPLTVNGVWRVSRDEELSNLYGEPDGLRN